MFFFFLEEQGNPRIANLQENIQKPSKTKNKNKMKLLRAKVYIFFIKYSKEETIQKQKKQPKKNDLLQLKPRRALAGLGLYAQRGLSGIGL